MLTLAQIDPVDFQILEKCGDLVAVFLWFELKARTFRSEKLPLPPGLLLTSQEISRKALRRAVYVCAPITGPRRSEINLRSEL
jgi:hypothetical protein